LGFVIRDHNGQALAHVYFEDEPGRPSGSQAAQQRRGAADCAEYRKIARAIAEFYTVIETLRSCLRVTNWRGTSPLGFAFLCMGGNQEASHGSAAD
jgi:hypothetical protein